MYIIILGMIFIIVMITIIVFGEEIIEVTGEFLDNRHKKKMRELEIKNREFTHYIDKTKLDYDSFLDNRYFKEVNQKQFLCKCKKCGDTISVARYIDEHFNSALKILTGVHKWHLVNDQLLCQECWKEYRKTLEKPHKTPIEDTTSKQEF